MIVQFCGGPLDGQRRIQRELPIVCTVSLPKDWTASTSQEHRSSARAVTYTLRTDPGTGRPAVDRDGHYTYEHHG